ncbi:MAG: hypothetical protein QM666_03735 [Acinetobacter sp.]
MFIRPLTKIAVITAVVLGYLGPNAVAHEAKHNDLAKRLSHLVEEYTVPHRVDDQTVLQSVTTDGKSLIFVYTFDSIEGLNPKHIELSAINVLCLDDQLATEIDDGATISVQYYDLDGTLFIATDVTRQTCGR